MASITPHEPPEPPRSDEPSAADTPPPSPAPMDAPSGAVDSWLRNDAPLPRWSEPAAARPAEPPPVGVFTGLGIVAATFVVTLVAIWFAGGAPMLLLHVLTPMGTFDVDAYGGDAVVATIVAMGLSILLVVVAIAFIAWWCNRPSRRHIRVPLNIGLGCAVAPIALGAVLFGLCISILNGTYQ